MNINANNIITEFSQANMNAIIQAYPLGDLRYREHFPLLYNPLLTYSNIEGADGAKIMAEKHHAKGASSWKTSREKFQRWKSPAI